MRETKRPIKIYMYYTIDVSSWQNSDTQAISNQI